MAFFYAPLDPLIESLPDPMRKAYRAAECALMSATNVVIQIAGSRADLLPEAIGSLQAHMPGWEANVLPVEGELAAARRLEPYLAMQGTYTTAHVAALDYGKKVAGAVDQAFDTYHLMMVDAWGAEGEDVWAKAYRKLLSDFDVVTDREVEVYSGPEWTTFRERFRGRLPAARTDDLLTHMRLEVAAWAEGRDTSPTDQDQDERRRPAAEAGKRVRGAALPPESPTPRWDDDNRTLYLGGEPIKIYKSHPAPNQIELLSAFEKEGWRVSIPDPFRDAKKLNNTIAALNVALGGTRLSFHGDGTGEGVRWQIRKA
jgi:hypothetical protein